MTTDKNEIIEMQVNTSALRDLIGGIHDLAESLIPSAFGYTAAYYHKNKDERDDWFCEQYSLVAGAVRLISAAAQVVDVGLVNGEIEFDRGPYFEIKASAKNQTNPNTAA